MLLKSLFNKKILISICGVLLVLIAGLIIFSSVLLTQKTFYKGVAVDGIDISRMNMEQAKTLISNNANKILNNSKIVLNSSENTWIINLDDISYEILYDQALDKAYKEGREGNILQRLFRIIYLNFNSTNIVPESSYEKNLLYKNLVDTKKQIDKDKKDASVIYNNGNVIINKEVTGRLLDIDNQLEIVENHIVNRNFSNIDLIVKEQNPKIVYNNISDINSVLESFYTTFSQQDENRTHNIKLACEKINNAILLPGEIFSMSAALGPRTLENGYLEAPVIFKNELIKGAGGGVCQVTTTLYNAVLKSRLEVVERVHHSLPLGYVEPGRDATIAEDYIDFKFKNNRNYSICINAEVNGNVLQIRILSRKDTDESIIKLKSEVVAELTTDEEDLVVDDSVPDGQKVVVHEAKKGLKVIVYRETYSKDGVLARTEKISEDVYKPVKAQVKVNQNYYNEIKGL